MLSFRREQGLSVPEAEQVDVKLGFSAMLSAAFVMRPERTNVRPMGHNEVSQLELVSIYGQESPINIKLYRFVDNISSVIFKERVMLSGLDYETHGDKLQPICNYTYQSGRDGKSITPVVRNDIGVGEAASLGHEIATLDAIPEADIMLELLDPKEEAKRPAAPLNGWPISMEELKDLRAFVLAGKPPQLPLA